MTEVTLRVGTGYQVLFLDVTTDTELIAQSSAFEVKAPGSQCPLAWALVPNFLSDILPM